MKALSIRQPWAWIIVNGYKDIENRTWHTRFRGRVLIHAGKGMTREEYVDAANFALELGVKAPPFRDLERGGVVGIAEIVDCTSSHPSPWFVGPYGFVLRDARPFPFVPCKGELGFFEVPDLEAAR